MIIQSVNLIHSLFIVLALSLFIGVVAGLTYLFAKKIDEKQREKKARKRQ
jgi:hypothetical protein